MTDVMCLGAISCVLILFGFVVWRFIMRSCVKGDREGSQPEEVQVSLPRRLVLLAFHVTGFSFVVAGIVGFVFLGLQLGGSEYVDDVVYDISNGTGFTHYSQMGWWAGGQALALSVIGFGILWTGLQLEELWGWTWP